MRVPAEGVVVEPAERDLDEGYATLHQPAREEAALAEQVLAIGFADLVFLLLDLERLGGFGLHELDGALVGSLMTGRTDAGMIGNEVLLDVAEQLRAGIGLLAGDSRGPIEILDLEHLLIGGILARLSELLSSVADDERGILWSEEAGAESRGVEETIRRDADEIGQLEVGLADFELPN